MNQDSASIAPLAKANKKKNPKQITTQNVTKKIVFMMFKKGLSPLPFLGYSLAKTALITEDGIFVLISAINLSSVSIFMHL